VRCGPRIREHADLAYPVGGTGARHGRVEGETMHRRTIAAAAAARSSADPGAIDVTCTSDVPAYAAVSSATAPGWTVSVDDRDSAWLTADVLRRAVRIEPGTHRIAWRYQAPGLTIGLVLAGIAVLGLIALYLANRAR
jgi:hypothetical protein